MFLKFYIHRYIICTWISICCVLLPQNLNYEGNHFFSQHNDTEQVYLQPRNNNKKNIVYFAFDSFFLMSQFNKFLLTTIKYLDIHS